MKHFKRKHVLAIIATGILISIAAYYCNYYWERSIPFDYVTGVPLVEGYYPHGDRLVQTKEEMYEVFCSDEITAHYDSAFLSQYIEAIDYEKYDYIISYMGRITAMSYSPYLSDTEDGMPSVPKIPIISRYKKQKVDSLYIYRIQTSDKFRVPGP